MSKKLLPCPFQPCNGKGRIRELGFYVTVVCDECGASGPRINTDISDFVYENEDPKQEAGKAWNERK